MNKLECTLTELNTMVEWGCRWLSDHKPMSKAAIIEKVFDECIRIDEIFSDEDIENHIMNEYSSDDIIENLLCDDDVQYYCRTHYSVDDVFEEYEIIEYVNNHMDDNLFEEFAQTNLSVETLMDIAMNMSGNEVTDYIKQNVGLADMVEWSDSHPFAE